MTREQTQAEVACSQAAVHFYADVNVEMRMPSESEDPGADA